jgi:uncharacterized cupredoxin-like copper-binding protein
METIMRRSVVVLVICAVVLSVGLAAAQQATPDSKLATPVLCASPIAGTDATPILITTAAPSAASPGGSEPGEDLGLYACASPSAEAAPSQASDTTPSVVMGDIFFQPKEITIPANTDVTIELPNQGASVHTFDIDELNIHTGEVQPGATTTVTINAPAGDYVYYCAIPGHKEAGMVGTLHVQ